MSADRRHQRGLEMYEGRGRSATNISTQMGKGGNTILLHQLASLSWILCWHLIHMQTEDRHRRSFNVMRASFMVVSSSPEDFTSVTYPTNGHFLSYLEKRLPFPLSLPLLNAPKRKSLHFSWFPNVAAQWIPRALTTKTALFFSSSSFRTLPFLFLYRIFYLALFQFLLLWIYSKS